MCPFCPQCLCSAAVHRGSDYIRECGHCWVMQQVPCDGRSSPISTWPCVHINTHTRNIFTVTHPHIHTEFIADVLLFLKETFYCHSYQFIYICDTQGCTLAHDNGFNHAELLGNIKPHDQHQRKKDQNHMFYAMGSWRDRRPLQQRA